MALAYAEKLELKVWSTNVKAHKIDKFILEIYKMVLASFKVQNKYDTPFYFQGTFFIANISINILLCIIFINFSNIDI